MRSISSEDPLQDQGRVATVTNPSFPTTAPLQLDSTASASPTTGSAARSLQWRLQLGLLRPRASFVLQDEDQTIMTTRNEDFKSWIHDNPYPTTEQDDDCNHEQKQDETESFTHQRQATTSDPIHSSVASLDPLTAMMMEETQKNERLQQMDLEYRKEKARRKRTTNHTATVVIEDEDYDENAVTLSVIDKDLHRLAHPAGNEPSPDCVVLDPTTTRRNVLRQVLFLYQCRHPEPGYRQGMHEVASYLLYCLELDASTWIPVSRQTEEGYLDSFLGSECYAMLERILTEIQLAYDVNLNRQAAQLPPGQEGGQYSYEKPMEGMSRRIMSHIAHCDAPLLQLLQNLQVEPAIYLTKWIRLIFTREIPSVEEVWILWDFVFDHMAKGYTCMNILEALAAGRLLRHRSDLYHAQDNLLHLLMNLPPETDVPVMLKITKAILTGQQVLLPPVAPLPASATHGMLGVGSDTLRTPESYLLDGGNMGTPLDVNAAMLSMKRFSLTSVTEKLANKTQSISKRLYKEWENIATVNGDEDPLQQRSYDDPAWHGSWHTDAQTTDGTAATTSPARSNIYHPTDGANGVPPSPYPGQATNATRGPQSENLAQPFTTTTPTSTIRSEPPLLKWGQEMETQLAILQNFAMMVEKQQLGQGNPYGTIPGATKAVPDTVWGALADLEVVRQDILKHANR